MAAVIFITGCATKRDVQRVEEQVVAVKHEQRDLSSSVNKMDSLLSAETASSAQLRAELRSTLDDMNQQFQMIQSNIQDLQSLINQIKGTQQQIYVFKPDSGSTTAAVPQDTAGGSMTIPVTPDTARVIGDTQPVPGIDCQQIYDDAFVNIVRGQYEDAIGGFDEYLGSCGKQDLADDARYWKGEAYYSMGKYREAIEEFSILDRDFSGSEKRPGALYKMARSHEELKQIGKAKELFQKLVDEYPGTLEGEQAKNKLKDL